MRTGDRIERRVLLEAETMVTLQMPPRSICSLYHPASPGRRLQLDADDRGIVRFHATAKVGAQPVELRLEYSDDSGLGWRRAVSLSADFHSTPSMSAPELVSAPVVSGSVRTALEGDPMQFSGAELVAGGYPPRPDPVKAPAQYARWLRAVSQPLTVVSPRTVAHPELAHSPRPSLAATGPGQPQPGSVANADWDYWCGAYLAKPSGQFYDISASWDVPTVISNGPEFSAVVEWVGLDNAAGDLYQAGTGSECLNLDPWNIVTYFMWMESLPWSWWVVPGFPVAPGDTVTVDIWVANQIGTTIFQDPSEGNDGLTRADNSVWFYLMSSNGSSFMGTYPTAPESIGGQQSTGFSGQTAEFILERPTINGEVVPLAFFAPTLMRGCSYGDALYGDWTQFSLGPDNGTEPFDGNLTYITMVDSANDDILATPIVIPDPSGVAGAYSMMYLWQDWE
jgi:hypothetical protein